MEFWCHSLLMRSEKVTAIEGVATEGIYPASWTFTFDVFRSLVAKEFTTAGREHADPNFNALSERSAHNSE
jgi:hypothetical protein